MSLASLCGEHESYIFITKPFYLWRKSQCHFKVCIFHTRKCHGNVLTQWILSLWAQGHHKKLNQAMYIQRDTIKKSTKIAPHYIIQVWIFFYCDKLLWSYRLTILTKQYYFLTWADFWALVAHECVAAIRMLAVVGGGALERPVPWIKIILLNALTLLYHNLSGRLGDDCKTQASRVAGPIDTSLTITQQSWFRKERRDSRLGHI